MPRIKIVAYMNGETVIHDFSIPTRVTITGKEDHFRRAVEDADMIELGMRSAFGYSEDVRTWIQTVTMD